VSMRAAGAAASSPPVLSWTLNAKAGAAYTVAGVGAGSAVRGVVIKDDLAAPPHGDGRVRVIQAASRAPQVKVVASGGHLISASVPFATVSGYQTLPAGTWTVQASVVGQAETDASGPVKIAAGQVTSILLLDAKSKGIELRTVLDSADSGTAPGGAVDAGAGGTARNLVDTGSSGGTPLLPVLLGGLLALAVLAVGPVQRVRRSRRSGAA
jgi:hypothetical protein